MPFDTQIPGAIGPEHWFAQAWALALGEIAEALDLGGGSGPLEVRAGAASPEKWAEWTDAIWHSQTWTPGAGAEIRIGCPASVPQALWSHIGGTDAPEAAAETLETFREMLNQSASSAASEASSRLGSTIEVSEVEKAQPPDTGWAVELHFEAAGASQTIAISGNVGMAQALNPPAVEEATPEPPPPARPSPPARSVEPQSDPLELIREVSMELAVSFGDTTLPLADVLKLASGAIIELNRSVSDPVEVLVNGSVIARGDVVVVDGNYGVRITEIVSRRARVRSML